MREELLDSQFIANTNGVKVIALPRYIKEESNPLNSFFLHSYNIIIENSSDEEIQLINRHWIITSGGKSYADVKGEGVVGKQPILKPNFKFDYTSFSAIDSEYGTMEGTFTFRKISGEFFDVVIPKFDLFYEDLTLIQ
ncbi:UNVERIFIED_CONTAM: hypothetical protein GTU68_002663 [Idotea baltica]|nr:hypothetical protein [Idotea baltica]